MCQKHHDGEPAICIKVQHPLPLIHNNLIGSHTTVSQLRPIAKMNTSISITEGDSDYHPNNNSTIYATTYQPQDSSTKRARPACFNHTDPLAKRTRVISPHGFTHPFRDAMTSQDGPAIWEALWGPRYRPKTTADTTADIAAYTAPASSDISQGKGQATKTADTGSVIGSGTPITGPSALDESGRQRKTYRLVPDWGLYADSDSYDEDEDEDEDDESDEWSVGCYDGDTEDDEDYIMT